VADSLYIDVPRMDAERYVRDWIHRHPEFVIDDELFEQLVKLRLMESEMIRT